MPSIEHNVTLAAGLAIACAALPVAALAAPAARVEFAVGNPQIVNAGGQTRALQKGAQIETGDLVATNDGRVQLRFTDGARVSLQPQTRFRVDDYRWEGKADGSERGFFSLLKGGLRTITGAVGRSNKRNYQVNTGVATIGIRGTEYKIAEFGDGIIGSIGEGGVNVCSGLGCAAFNSGESFLVPTKQSEPTLTDKQIDLPPTQPGDPAGGAFQTANDPTKNPGESPFIAGNQTNAAGAPVGLIPTVPQTPNGAQQTLNGVYAEFGSVGSVQHFTAGTVVLDSAGAVVQLPGRTSAGLLPGPSFGNDKISAWGAFKDTAGVVVHYAVGLPVDIAPKIATYALAAPGMATVPTNALGNPVGTLLSWNQTVDFTLGQGAASATWELQGTQFNAQLSGSFDGPLNLSGQCAAQSCFVNAQGLPYGPGANRFGVAYQLNAFRSPSPTNPQPTSVSAQGAAMLTQTGAQ